MSKGMEERFICFGCFDERVYNCIVEDRCPYRRECMNLTEMNKVLKEVSNNGKEVKNE